MLMHHPWITAVVGWRMPSRKDAMVIGRMDTKEGDYHCSFF